MSNPLKFGIIGAAAYVAPRHLQAIHDTGNTLIAALDPYDNVGHLDRLSPNCAYFTEFERFDRHASKLERRGEGFDWVSVCTPNYLHDSHCMSGLRWGANIICEKPLVMSPWNLDELQEAEVRYSGRIYTVMQLRLHAVIQKLQQSLPTTDGLRHVDLTYITSRGPWYSHSWKNDEAKSGGIIFNIGIHFLDVLLQLFGPVRQFDVFHRDRERIMGVFEHANTVVRWFLSISRDDLPADVLTPTYRSLTIDGEEVEFSGGFTDLHTQVYRETLAGHGVGIDDVRPTIVLGHAVRNAKCRTPHNAIDVHPLAKRYTE